MRKKMNLHNNTVALFTHILVMLFLFFFLIQFQSYETVLLSFHLLDETLYSSKIVYDTQYLLF